LEDKMKTAFVGVALLIAVGLSAAGLERSDSNLKGEPNRAEPHSSIASKPIHTSTTYNSLVKGMETNPGRLDSFVLAGKSEAEAGSDSLPGQFVITVLFNRATNQVIGGNWTLSVTENDSQVERGTLHGTVANGTVSFDEGGRVTAVSGVELHLAGGSGSYSDISNGVGSFEAAPPSEPSPNVSPAANAAGESAMTGPPSPPSEPGKPTDRAFNGRLILSF
jgi:hypothetical protein